MQITCQLQKTPYSNISVKTDLNLKDFEEFIENILLFVNKKISFNEKLGEK